MQYLLDHLNAFVNNGLANYTFTGFHLPVWAYNAMLGGIGLFVLVLVAKAILFRLFRVVFPYPMTQFGFRGKLVYVDTKDYPTLVCKQHNVSARPDFIYRLNDGKYALLELKGRKTNVLESDIAQMEVGIVAARTKFPITRGAVVLGDNTTHWQDSAKKSNGALMRKNRTEVTLARQIRDGKKLYPVRNDGCPTCVCKKKCWG